MDSGGTFKLRAAVLPDETAVFLASTYEVVRVDVPSGELRWTAPLEPAHWDVDVIGALLVVGGLHETIRLDPETGARIWRREGGLSAASTPSVLETFRVVGQRTEYERISPATGDRIDGSHARIDGLAGSAGNSLVALRAEEVRIFDSQSLERFQAVPLAGARWLVTTRYPYAVLVAEDKLVCLDVEQPEIQWSRTLRVPPDIFRRGAPARIRGGHLFIGYKDTIYQLDLQTGETVETHPVPRSARRLVVCDAGVAVAAGEQWIGPRAVTVALDVE